MSRILVAPELPDAAALGLEEFDGLFLERPKVDRLERLPDGRRGEERWRFALPGTPGPDGGLTGSPKGAGTGWLELWRWQRAGLKVPAEQAWNLLCHLRGKGVATPMPMLVTSTGILRRRSLVVVRELEEHRTWLAVWRESNGAERRLLERSLEAFIGRLARADVDAGGVVLDQVLVAPDEDDHIETDAGESIDCAVKAIVALQTERAQHAWRKNHMPSLVLADLGGIELAAWSESSRRAVWRRLVVDLGDAYSCQLELRFGRALSCARSRAARRAFLQR